MILLNFRQLFKVILWSTVITVVIVLVLIFYVSRDHCNTKPRTVGAPAPTCGQIFIAAETPIG